MPSKKTKKQKTTRIKGAESVDRQSKKPQIIDHFRAAKARAGTFLARRPHRSFRMTRRRDYVRSLVLPGYWAFTVHVYKILSGSKKLFVSLAIFYGVLTVLLVGLASQENYNQLSEMIRDIGEELVSGGDLSGLESAGLIFASIASGTLKSNMTEAQGIYVALLGLMVWLTAVWLLRSTLAGKRPRLRDGLYNAGAPLLSTFLVALALLVQLLPIILVVIAYGAASSTGLLNGGVEAMIFWTAAGGLGLLSLYWISSSLFALVVVTLPGMYPWQAMRTAGDLVVGRRIRLLLRILWLLLSVAVAWVIVMVPIILLDTWLKGVLQVIDWIPVVPIALLVMASVSVVWSSSYLYLLYRKVVDDGAAPA